VRASLNYVGWKERKQVAADLKAVYRAATAEETEQRLAQFAAQWDDRYAPISALWRRQWSQVIPFFAFPAEIRKVIYTTNVVESLNMSLRKALKPRVAFPSEEAALKVMYLALRNVIRKWDRSIHWKAALNCFTLLWEDRIRPINQLSGAKERKKILLGITTINNQERRLHKIRDTTTEPPERLFASKAPTASLPRPPLRLLPG
jgi:hypothetical protein